FHLADGDRGGNLGLNTPEKGNDESGLLFQRDGNDPGALKMVVAMSDKPRIAQDPPAHHDSIHTGLAEHPLRIGRSKHVAVSHDGNPGVLLDTRDHGPIRAAGEHVASCSTVY